MPNLFFLIQLFQLIVGKWPHFVLFQHVNKSIWIIENFKWWKFPHIKNVIQFNSFLAIIYPNSSSQHVSTNKTQLSKLLWSFSITYIQFTESKSYNQFDCNSNTEAFSSLRRLDSNPRSKDRWSSVRPLC